MTSERQHVEVVVLLRPGADPAVVMEALTRGGLQVTRLTAGVLAAGDAAAIVAHAEDEAKQLLAKAEADAAELVVRRGKMAEDKIAAAERGAVAEVRAKAADAAAKAAAAIIAEKHGATADKALVDKTIAGLGRPN